MNANIDVDISELAELGPDVVIWHGTSVREGAVISNRTTVGRNCYIGPGVRIGKNCKIQNHALIYEPAVLEDGVFIGPRAVITNDLNPRAVNPDMSFKSTDDWIPHAATVKTGASIGAGAICVGAIEIGEWSMVAAGSVVTNSVKPFALVAGVPARQIGWVGRAGFKLKEIGEGKFQCPRTFENYLLTASGDMIEQK